MAVASRTAAVRVEGLRELQRGCREMSRELQKEMRDELKKLGEKSAEEARFSAQGGTRQQARAAWNIASGATMRGATVGVSASSTEPYALGAFFGSKRPQFPGITWVGNSWEAGVAGQGPYFINDAVADNAAQIEEDLGDMVDRLAVSTRAFL